MFLRYVIYYSLSIYDEYLTYIHTATILNVLLIGQKTSIHINGLCADRYAFIERHIFNIGFIFLGVGDNKYVYSFYIHDGMYNSNLFCHSI